MALDLDVDFIDVEKVSRYDLGVLFKILDYLFPCSIELYSLIFCKKEIKYNLLNVIMFQELQYKKFINIAKTLFHMQWINTSKKIYKE